jgi:hypothetical protein
MAAGSAPQPSTTLALALAPQMGGKKKSRKGGKDGKNKGKNNGKKGKKGKKGEGGGGGGCNDRSPCEHEARKGAKGGKKGDGAGADGAAGPMDVEGVMSEERARDNLRTYAEINRWMNRVSRAVNVRVLEDLIAHRNKTCVLPSAVTAVTNIVSEMGKLVAIQNRTVFKKLTDFNRLLNTGPNTFTDARGRPIEMQDDQRLRDMLLDDNVMYNGTPLLSMLLMMNDAFRSNIQAKLDTVVDEVFVEVAHDPVAHEFVVVYGTESAGQVAVRFRLASDGRPDYAEIGAEGDMRTTAFTIVLVDASSADTIKHRLHYEGAGPAADGDCDASVAADAIRPHIARRADPLRSRARFVRLSRSPGSNHRSPSHGPSRTKAVGRARSRPVRPPSWAARTPWAVPVPYAVAVPVSGSTAATVPTPASRTAGQRRTPGASRPPSGASRPPSGASRPPSGASRPPSGASRPPSGASRPPSGASRPPSGASQPPSGTSQPPSGASQPPSRSKKSKATKRTSTSAPSRPPSATPAGATPASVPAP